MPDTPKIGWLVKDKDGNVIDSGPVVVAQAAGELADALKALTLTEKENN